MAQQDPSVQTTTEPVWFPTESFISHDEPAPTDRAAGLASYDEAVPVVNVSAGSNSGPKWFDGSASCSRRRGGRCWTSAAALNRRTGSWWAQLNIADSCFTAREGLRGQVHERIGQPGQWSYRELLSQTNRVSNGLRAGMTPGDAIAICTPMNAESVAIYLGIVRAGCVAVSIPDSFAADEIRAAPETGLGAHGLHAGCSWSVAASGCRCTNASRGRGRRCTSSSWPPANEPIVASLRGERCGLASFCPTTIVSSPSLRSGRSLEHPLLLRHHRRAQGDSLESHHARSSALPTRICIMTSGPATCSPGRPTSAG